MRVHSCTLLQYRTSNSCSDDIHSKEWHSPAAYPSGFCLLTAKLLLFQALRCVLCHSFKPFGHLTSNKVLCQRAWNDRAKLNSSLKLKTCSISLRIKAPASLVIFRITTDLLKIKGLIRCLLILHSRTHLNRNQQDMIFNSTLYQNFIARSTDDFRFLNAREIYGRFVISDKNYRLAQTEANLVISHYLKLVSIGVDL